MPKIYELRVYRCLPGQLPKILARFENLTLRIWARLGIRQAGFWTTAVGESNHDLTYMIEWDSLAERDEKWPKFQNDPEWLAGRDETEKNGFIVANVSNQLLMPTKFSSVQ